MAEKTGATRPTKSFMLLVYNTETEKEENAKQIVLNTKTGEFNEVSSTTNDMVRLRLENREDADKLAIVMTGIYKDPFKIFVKEINIAAEDNAPDSGMIVYLPSDRMGGMRIMAQLNHSLSEFKKTTEKQIHELKTGYISASRNTKNINHVLNEAMKVRHG